jgi:chromosome partitioning protein
MVISLINWKGGVGKTTSARNLSFNFSVKGFKTLVIDLDHQSNLSGSFAGYPGKMSEVFPQIYMDDDAEIPIYKISENYYLSPSNQRMVTKGSKMLVIDPHGVFRIRDKITSLQESLEIPFDYIFLDCGPQFDIVTQNVLMCSDYLLVPTELSLDAMKGIQNLRKEMEVVKSKYNPNIDLLGIFNYKPKFNVTYQQQALKFSREEFAGKILKTTIRENVRASEAFSLKQAVATYSPDATATMDFNNLTEEILAKLQSTHGN